MSDEKEERIMINATDADDAASETESLLSKDSVSRTWRKPYMPSSHDVMHSRLRFYRALNTNSLSSSFEPPPHVLPPTLLLPLVPFMSSAESRKSNIGAILSIASVMLGSTLVVIPWAYQSSGMLGGLLLVFGVGALAYYTSRLIVMHGERYEDFSEMCRDYVGKWAFYLSLLASIIILLGACMAYHTLMSNFLFMLVNAARHDEEESSLWSKRTAPIVIALMVFVMTLPKEMKLLVRISSFGFISVFVCLFFICYTSLSKVIAAGGLNGAILESSSTSCPDDKTCVPLFSPQWGNFASLLPVSFFCHNCILPIVNNSGDPARRLSNHAAGFGIVVLTYLSVGFIPSLAEAEPHRTTFNENYLATFSTFDGFALVTRAALLIQLTTIYPLLVAIVRSQIFGVTMKTAYPSFPIVTIHNLVLIAMSASIAAMLPDAPGQVLGYVGAVSGTIYVAVLPVTVHLMILREKGELTVLNGVWHGFLVLLGAFMFVQGMFRI